MTKTEISRLIDPTKNLGSLKKRARRAQSGRSEPQGNRFKIFFTTEYTEDTEFRFF